MSKRFAVLPVIAAAVVFVLSGVAEAQPAGSSASCKGAVSWARAAARLGSSVTVQARVVGTNFAQSSGGSPTFIDLGNSYPNPHRLTIVIWSENRSAFGGSPEVKFRGRVVCARGVVSTYRGVPQIVARATSQLVLVR
jgi:hypothetical protein